MLAHDLYFPAHGLGQLGVHAKKIGGKQGGLLSSGAGPDFEKGIFFIIGIFGQKEYPDFFLNLGKFPFQSFNFALGQFFIWE